MTTAIRITPKHGKLIIQLWKLSHTKRGVTTYGWVDAGKGDVEEVHKYIMDIDHRLVRTV